MWFKNLQLYRLLSSWMMVMPEQLAASLASHAFIPCTSLDLQSIGWISPRDNGELVHAVNQQMLITLKTEKKLLPASVVNQATKARAAEIEEEQGFAPGRKQLREIKENVADELLPRAFCVESKASVWIDPVNGWLVVDAASPAKADDVLKLLFKSIDSLALTALRTKQSPLSCMTSWLASDEAPSGFTVDRDTELRAAGEGNPTVRYVRHTLEPDDVGRHISAGKQCTRLAMTWADRISFILTESLAIKRVTPLDVLKEDAGSVGKNDDERFDSDFVLMAGELNRMLSDLVAALGGEFDQSSAE